MKKNRVLRMKNRLVGLKGWLAAFTVALSQPALATQDIGSVASTIYSNFAQLAQLVTAGSYLGGLAFAVGSIMKFKQHKDNPTQVQIGTPIALVLIAAALLFLPSILGVTGQTLFTSGGTVATSTGVAWTPGS